MRIKLYLVPIKKTNAPNWIGKNIFIESRDPDNPTVSIISVGIRIISIKIGESLWEVLHKDNNPKLFKMVAYVLDDVNEENKWFEVHPDNYSHLEQYLPRVSNTKYGIGILNSRNLPWENQIILCTSKDYHLSN